jgi:hypothetical protein
MSVRSNGEVEGPRVGARLDPPVHNLSQHRRRHYRASRTPPTIVRSLGENHYASLWLRLRPRS